MNNTVVVGRLVSVPKLEEDNENNNYCEFRLAVPRPYKNLEGVYETDFILVRAFRQIANNLIEFCEKGDLIGVKGMLQTDGNNMYVKCEKLTYLATNKTKEPDYDYE